MKYQCKTAGTITPVNKITIEELYNFVQARDHVKMKDLENDKVLSVNNIEILSMNSNLELEHKPATYIMTHLVKKEMFNVTVDGKTVKITADHSIMILRDGALTSDTVKAIEPGDMVFGPKGWTSQFQIESTGVEEIWVYDVEVEDNHNFIGNDILLHNSFYYTVEPLVKEKFGDSATQTMEVVEWCDRFDQKFMQKVVDDTINEYAELLNIFDPSQIGVEREIISDCAFFVAKKRYAARVLDMEGVRFTEDDPYIKVMGLEIARSSTPEWVKQKLQESIPVILDNDQFGVRKWRDETKAQYTSQPIESISAVGSASSLDYNLTDKGVPQGAKAVIAHNNWVKSQGLEDEIELLQAGEKYKRCYLLTPNRFGAEIISYNDSKIAKIIEEDGIFDYSTNFQKQFEGPLERMVEGMKFDIRDVPTFGNLEDW